MAPLGRQPGVVEVQPADLRTDGERRLHRIQLMTGTRHAHATGHVGARNDGPQMLDALGELHRQHGAPQRIQQHVACSVVGFLGVDRVIDHIVGDVDHRLVGIGTLGGADVEVTHREFRRRL